MGVCPLGSPGLEAMAGDWNQACIGNQVHPLYCEERMFPPVLRRIHEFLAALGVRHLTELCADAPPILPSNTCQRFVTTEKQHKAVLIADIRKRTLLRFLTSQRVPNGSPFLLTETFTSHRNEPFKGV